MYKKLSITFIFILFLMCIFCFKSYASTDFSVYDEASGKYTIKFSEDFVEELGLPASSIPYYSDNEDIRFVLIKQFNPNAPEGKFDYYAYFNDAGFVEDFSDNSDFNGTYRFIRSNGGYSALTYSRFEYNQKEFYNCSNVGSFYFSVDSLSNILVSSDDIYNNVSGNLIVSKTSYSGNGNTSDNGDNGNTGDNENTGDSVGGGNTEEEKPEFYSFHGFNGVDYKLSPLPEKIKKYKHFIIVIDDSKDLHLFGFNDSLSITYVDGFVDFNGDEDTTLKHFIYTNNTWKEYAEAGIYSFEKKGTKVIYSCIDLLEYAEDFNSGKDFFYPLPQIVTSETLSSLVGRLEMRGVLKEIIIILPIIIVILVGLVGLRKALKTLFQVLRRS